MARQARCSGRRRGDQLLAAPARGSGRGGLNWTLSGSARAMSGVITGSVLQPARRAVKQACSASRASAGAMSGVIAGRSTQRAGERRARLRHQRRALVDEAGVDLHEVGAGVALGTRIGARHDAADADDRKDAARGPRAAGDDPVRARASGAPDRPPALLARAAWPATASRASVVLVAITPSIAWRAASRRSPRSAPASRSGAILRNIGTVRPCSAASSARRRCGGRRAARRARRRPAASRRFLRVRARDVDGHVVGVRIHAGQADQVVVDRALDRRRRVLADVEAEDAAACRESAPACTLAMKAARPSLLKPRRLISAVGLRRGERGAASDCPAAPAA